MDGDIEQEFTAARGLICVENISALNEVVSVLRRPGRGALEVVKATTIAQAEDRQLASKLM
jgi:hypothetical protein